MNSEPKAKHTPGPWRLGTNSSTKIAILSTRELVFPHGYDWGDKQAPTALAICYGESEIRKANARLIASAPELEAQRDELLAVCKALVVAWDDKQIDCGRIGFTEIWQRLIDPARAAIARAEKKE